MAASFASPDQQTTDITNTKLFTIISQPTREPTQPQISQKSHQPRS